MTRARESIIDLASTPYYHCISRCVRRAFLCGEDKFSGKSFEHRRDWVVERITWLTNTFAIDVASYVVMSNHYHLVLSVDCDKAKEWTELAVVRRWKKVYHIPPVVKLYLSNPEAEGIAGVALQIIAKWRARLMDISWFMRCLNGYLARKANAEDECKGRFWEGRFKSQPLLDEAAVLTAMSYVDLNPIRAKIAKTPEASDYTSVQQRIEKQKNAPQSNTIPLTKLVKPHQHNSNKHIAFSEKDYLQLVDWAGRAIAKNKRGWIDDSLPPILERLNLNSEGFIDLMSKKDDISKLSVIGSPVFLIHYQEKFNKKFIKGSQLSRQLFC